MLTFSRLRIFIPGIVVVLVSSVLAWQVTTGRHIAHAQSPAFADTSLTAANFVKTDLNAANYQYPPLGNGGLNLFAGPTGFTDMQPPNAAYAPDIYYDYWWDNNTARVNPFTLQGGYGTGPTLQDGTITSFQQTLDVSTGVETTTLGLTTCQGCSSFTSTRTEFITHDGVLVMQINDSQTATFSLMITPQSGYALTATAQSNGIAFISAKSGQQAMGIAAVINGQNSTVDTTNGIVSAQVAPSQPVTLYIAARGLDSSQPAQDALALAQQASQDGYAARQITNSSFWSNFWGQSSISVPDPNIMTAYIRSQYILGALMSNTAIPFGCWGPRKEGYNGGQCSEYDLEFPHLAMLTANQSAVTAPTATWIENTLPAATALAPLYIYNNGPTTGAKYPYISSWNGQETTLYGTPPTTQDWEAFPSANAALIDLLQAQYTNDATRLNMAKQVLQKVTQYQLDNSTQDPAYNNQWLSQKFWWQWNPGQAYQKGAAIEQAALQWSLNEASALGVGPSAWRTDAQNVYLPTAFDAARQQNVIMGYAGDTPSIANSTFPMMMPLFFFDTVDPNNPLFWPTFLNIASSNDINYTFNRGWAATVAAMAGNGDDALVRLDRLIPANGPTDVNGGGVYWDDTYYSECNGVSFGCYGAGPSNTPEVGAHGALMLGTQHMLLDGSDMTTIKVFPALPTSWESAGVSFQNLAANGGFLVSGTYSESQVSVTVQNTGPATATRTVSLRMPSTATGVTDAQGIPITGINGRFAQLTLTLGAGASQSITLTPTGSGTWTTVDDTSTAIQYSPNWATATNLSGFVNSTAHYSTTTGASAQFTFTGQAVRIIGDRNSDHGQLRVYLDGKLQADEDSFAPSESPQHVLFEADGLAPRNHTIQIVVTGLQDAYSNGTDVTLDALQYLSGGTSGQQTIVDDTAGSYDANWSSDAMNGYFQNTAHWSNTPGASMHYTFTGTGIQWIGAASTAHGKASVQIDTGPAVVVDTYAPIVGNQAVLFERTGLSAGQHTITITVLSDRNAQATDDYTDVDAFVVETGAPSATGIDDNARIGLTYTPATSWDVNAALGSYFQSTAHYTNTAGAAVTFTFTGTAVTWYGAAKADHGQADVQIDGGPPVTVDTYAPVTGTQTILFNRVNLAYGPHTVTITCDGTHDANASNSTIDVDAVAAG